MSLGIASPEGSATPGGSGRRRPSGVGGHAYSTPRPLPWTTSRGALLPGGWNFPAKWAINGLTPVRPLVVMKVDAKILPGRVLVIA